MKASSQTCFSLQQCTFSATTSLPLSTYLQQQVCWQNVRVRIEMGKLNVFLTKSVSHFLIFHFQPEAESRKKPEY